MTTVGWRMYRWAVCLALLLAVAIFPVIAANDDAAIISGKNGVFTPVPGDPLRKALMNSLREEVKRQHALEVVFVVVDLKVKGGWAWVHTRPQSRDGSEHYEDVLALLRSRDGVWGVAEIPCTEVDNPECIDSPDYFVDLKKRFPGMPAEILPHM